MEQYEKTYGICNHDAVSDIRPLSLIAMHPGENAAETSTLYERIEQFAELRINKYFGLSLTEFLELPSHVCVKILETANKQVKIESAVTDTLAQHAQTAASRE